MQREGLYHHWFTTVNRRRIAKQFAISEPGVKKHLKLIFAKLGAANRTEAVAIALRKQLLKT